jgi:hypothetical protein
MAKQQSNSPSSKKSQQSSSDALLPPSLQNLSDAEIKLAQPLLAMLKDPSRDTDKVLELLHQPQELKVLAVDIFLVRALLEGDSKTSGAQSSPAPSKSKPPKLTEEQKEKVTNRLLRFRENPDLPQDKRIEKVWHELSKKIPGLSIWQVRAHDAHITMRINSGLS